MNKTLSNIKVGLDFGDGIQAIGRLALSNGIIYFEYDADFADRNIEISPFQLPFQKGVIELPRRPFNGLAGVFDDSLPDGWGRLLFDRMIAKHGLLPTDVSPIDRLAHVGLFGMGALVYEPDQSEETDLNEIDLDEVATQTQEVLNGDSDEVLNNLLELNGSSAGARPKALIGLNPERNRITFGARHVDTNEESWIVKFPNSLDGIEAGTIEYIYSLMAKSAGVTMPETHLFNSQNTKGYFAIKRFDRIGEKRLHMHTAAGLLHSDFRFPSLDYSDLLNLTGALTKDVKQLEKIFRLAVFNVLAHNRDDHAKNFSFLMDENGKWKISPAYDLTFSSGPAGQQSTMVMRNGENPSKEDLINLGLMAKLPKKWINEVLEQTHDALSQWKALAQDYDLSKRTTQIIAKKLNS